jgi:glutamate-1-semialdehyde 2,1-aminomutase
MARNSGAHERELVELARRVLPAGGFGNVTHEIIIQSGRAGRVWDVSGNEYVDYLLGSGPMIVGHAHPEVVEVVQQQAAKGTTFFANNELGIRLAEEITQAVPCAAMVRFVSTGSEADLYAMRLARAATGRDKILKFEGGYHGMSDYGLMSLAPKRAGNFPQPIPDSAGIPRSVRDEILVAPFNDLQTVASLVREHAGVLAAIMVEPFQRLIPPQPGFLEGLRKIADENGLVLIFDEVVTGFRFAYGGAQAYFGVTPDICTLGKAIGGGFPLAAIAGRADIMAHFDKSAVAEDRFMMQIGTLSGNPVAAAAGLKTLEILKRPGAYEQIFKTGRALMDGYTEIIARHGIKARVVGDAPLFDVVFTDREVRDYRSALGDEAAMKRLNVLLRERGILKGESKYYISLAHTAEDVAFTLDAFAAALGALKRGARAA